MPPFSYRMRKKAPFAENDPYSSHDLSTTFFLRNYVDSFFFAVDSHSSAPFLRAALLRESPLDPPSYWFLFFQRAGDSKAFSFFPPLVVLSRLPRSLSSPKGEASPPCSPSPSLVCHDIRLYSSPRPARVFQWSPKTPPPPTFKRCRLFFFFSSPKGARVVRPPPPSSRRVFAFSSAEIEARLFVLR